MKKCVVFGVIAEVTCSTQLGYKMFFTENHLYMPSECINILYFIRVHGSVTAILCSGHFPKIMPFMK
jgi:hypothetical protein